MLELVNLKFVLCIFEDCEFGNAAGRVQLTYLFNRYFRRQFNNALRKDRKTQILDSDSVEFLLFVF